MKQEQSLGDVDDVERDERKVKEKTEVRVDLLEESHDV